MDKQELLKMQEQVAEKFGKFKSDYCEFMKRLDIDEDYWDEEEDAQDEFEALQEIPYEYINFNDAMEEREYNNYEHKYWMLDRLSDMCDDLLQEEGNKKVIHQNKKSVETLITSFRRIKHESEEVIEKENKMIEMVNNGLRLLEEMRK